MLIPCAPHNPRYGARIFKPSRPPMFIDGVNERSGIERDMRLPKGRAERKVMEDKMKKEICFLIGLLLPSGAGATVVDVVTRPVATGGGASLLVFNYNENGRAWIEEKDTNGFSRDNATQYLHYHLPGLRFNAATREIQYGRVTCATVVPMGFGYGVFKTGRCNLSAVHSSRSYESDDGLQSTEFENVLMEVR
jgi:hypothetical protein